MITQAEREIAKQAIDDLKANLRTDAPVSRVLSAEKLRVMRKIFGFAQPNGYEKMTPRAPAEADVAAEVVGRHERQE